MTTSIPHGSAAAVRVEDDPTISIARCKPRYDHGRVIANPYECAYLRLLSPAMGFKGTYHLDCGRPCEKPGLSMGLPEGKEHPVDVTAVASRSFSRWGAFQSVASTQL